MDENENFWVDVAKESAKSAAIAVASVGGTFLALWAIGAVIEKVEQRRQIQSD